jgi:hypothetical protein
MKSSPNSAMFLKRWDELLEFSTRHARGSHETSPNTSRQHISTRHNKCWNLVRDQEVGGSNSIASPFRSALLVGSPESRPTVGHGHRIVEGESKPPDRVGAQAKSAVENVGVALLICINVSPFSGGRSFSSVKLRHVFSLFSSGAQAPEGKPTREPSYVGANAPTP